MHDRSRQLLQHDDDCTRIRDEKWLSNRCESRLWSHSESAILLPGLGRGFVVSGADSRTAVADSAGGKTQMTSVFASIAIVLVLLFLTAPLAYLPSTALAAILIASSISLFDLASLRRYYRISKPEFRHAVVAMLGVMTVGVLMGVLIAVGLAMLKLLMLASKPHDAVLGVVPGKDRFSNIAEESEAAKPIPRRSCLSIRLLTSFFQCRSLCQSRQAGDSRGAERSPARFVLDAEAMSILDTTGADVLEIAARRAPQAGNEFQHREVQKVGFE